MNIMESETNDSDYSKDAAARQMEKSLPPSVASEDNIEKVIENLESLIADPTKMFNLPQHQKIRLMTAAGRVSLPHRGHNGQQKNFKKIRLDHMRKKDKTVLNETQIRKIRAASTMVKSPYLKRQDSSTQGPGHLSDPHKCYICKDKFNKVHFFYDRLCETCGRFNYRKRYQTADLSDRVALVTGGRLKIGYETVLKLLRCGARVVVTTRFPVDAVKRYSSEEDFNQWKQRLEIFALDLRYTPNVDLFAQFLLMHLPRLDFIIHNACQTIRRPAGFYRHLMDFENKTTINNLPQDARSILGTFVNPALELTNENNCRPTLPSTARFLPASADSKSLTSADLSQLVLLPEDIVCDTDVFPLGHLDQDQQQLDLRSTNSWRLKLADVSTVELLEVQLINVVAPFVLNAKLKPLMLKHHNRDKHIVNVSAVEGQFFRNTKTDRHPHTNMAKAALNMMTRTSASDYAKDGIYMNSVDTGWVSEENPAPIAQRKLSNHDFQPPLDIVDGAARILDPIIDGYNTNEHQYGCFFKDYKPTVW